MCIRMSRSAWAAKDRVELAHELERVVIMRVATNNMTNGAHFNTFSITPAIPSCQSIEQLGCLTYVAFHCALWQKLWNLIEIYVCFSVECLSNNNTMSWWDTLISY